MRELRRVTRSKARLMAVVKANGYGHGATEVARQALHHGAEALGVARRDEGTALRAAGFDCPILVLGRTSPAHTLRLLECNLTQTVCAREDAQRFSDAAVQAGKTLTVHAKIDTGMGRLGFLHDALKPAPSGDATPTARTIAAIKELPGLELEGIFTHFAASDSFDKTSARRQFELFSGLLDELEGMGCRIPVRHAANSGAIIDLPETHLDMVRAGISLYGFYPSAEVDKARLALTPVMTLKSTVIQLKEVPAGFAVSYGGTYKTPRPTRVAAIAAGYADGFNRLLSSRGEALVRGVRAPVIGRVCMDLTMLDVGHIPDVRVGDAVTLIGRQGNEAVTADDLAAKLDTINYEIVTSVAGRVPRVYGGA